MQCSAALHGDQPEPFKPVELTITLETQEELTAYSKYNWYTGTTRDMLRTKASEGCRHALSEEEIGHVHGLMRKIRRLIRDKE